MRLFLVLLLGTSFAVADEQSATEDSIKLFDKTVSLINQNFYDKTFRGLPWEIMVKKSRSELERKSSKTNVVDQINLLLSQLKSSHTEFISFRDQEFWALESIFSGNIDGASLKHIGAWFVKIDNRWFVKYVLNNSPADRAGLLRGDEIISVDDKVFEPVKSFSGVRLLHSVKILRKNDGRPTILATNTIHQSFQRAMLEASRDSYKLLKKCGKNIAYFHLWSGSNDQSRLLLSEIAKKAEAEADGLVLDLRDGFGGAHPAFLNPFYDYDDNGKPIVQIFSKPMVLLINDGVRSGKEWISNILKSTKRATLVGTKTKGYFLAGKLFKVIPGKYDLYLAVSKPKPPAPDLEGIGVMPDIEIVSDMPYSAGLDPQFDHGVLTLGKIISKDCIC